MAAKNLCSKCGTPHEPLIDCVISVRTVVLQLIGRIGRLDRCSQCGESIYWLRLPDRTLQPFTAAGFFHGACEGAPPAAQLATLDEQLAAVKRMMLAIGAVSNCSRCLAPLFWIRHPNGANTPYTEAGLNHFIDCPKADEFRRVKR